MGTSIRGWLCVGTGVIADMFWGGCARIHVFTRKYTAVGVRGYTRLRVTIRVCLWVCKSVNV